jgi:hypothetical protein
VKYFLMLALLVTTSAFASEIESHRDACEDVLAGITKKHRELSVISSRIVVLDHDNPEAYLVDFRQTEDCETVVSEYQILIGRRERVQKEIASLEREKKRVCPRVYPE